MKSVAHNDTMEETLPMLSAENLIIPIVFAFFIILFWEFGIRFIKIIFRKRSSSFRSQYQKQRVTQEKEKILRDIKQEASTIMGQGHFVGMLIKDRILKETRQEARRIIQEAKNEIEKIRMEATNIFQDDMADTAFVINQQVQSNLRGYVRGTTRTSQKVINTYLDNHTSKKESRINKLL